VEAAAVVDTDSDADGAASIGSSPGGELPSDGGIADDVSGVAHLAADAFLRTASWGFGKSIRIGGRLARAAVDPEAALQLAGEVGDGVRGYARQLLGISDLDERVTQLMPPTGDGRPRPAHRGRPAPSALALREQGAELLRQSTDVDGEDATHPAFARIIGELAPDEGRILRMLATDGPQPYVDVHSVSMVGLGAQKFGSKLNMIGALAGCRHVERVPSYLDNLGRLGLIWFSHATLEDPIRYQVLEAQPEVMEAMKRARGGRTHGAKSSRRTIRLTQFGSDFCRACLSVGVAEVEVPATGDVVNGDDYSGPAG
jgi:hypothetical protein